MKIFKLSAFALLLTLCGYVQAKNGGFYEVFDDDGNNYRYTCKLEVGERKSEIVIKGYIGESYGHDYGTISRILDARVLKLDFYDHDYAVENEDQAQSRSFKAKDGSQAEPLLIGQAGGEGISQGVSLFMRFTDAGRKVKPGLIYFDTTAGVSGKTYFECEKKLANDQQ